MMKLSPKLIAGAASFVVAAGVSAVLFGTAGHAAGASSVSRPAVHQRVAIGATGATAVGLTLSVKPAPVRIAVQPAKVTLKAATKPAKITKSGTDPVTCPNMGGSGGYASGGHGGKPGGH